MKLKTPKEIALAIFANPPATERDIAAAIRADRKQIAAALEAEADRVRHAEFFGPREGAETLRAYAAELRRPS